jgi:hypothetical protein
VAALRAIGTDMVVATVLDVTEAEALLLRHRMGLSERRSALEEAWLLSELHERQGWTLEVLARRFVRSTSWVSRRLSLVRDLPESVQDQVRQGRLSAQAAMKHLVPLARANMAQAQERARRAAADRRSVRQLGEVVSAWRRADPTLRERIVAYPELFLRSKEVASGQTERAATERELVADIRRLGALACRAFQTATALSKERPSCAAREVVITAWEKTACDIARLGDLLVHGLDHAR